MVANTSSFVLIKYSHWAISETVKVAFYQTQFGRSPVQDFISGLGKSDQARFADVFEGIEKYGVNCPRAKFRQLKGKLWEIKFNSPGGGYRVAYVIVANRNTMIWLHAFKKTTQKTPAGDLQIAEQRMKEVFRS